MEDETVREIRIKKETLRVFINNVALAGVGVMDDNETRSQFDSIYNDIQICIHDEKMELFAPPLPHQGTFIGNQTLTHKHQTLIVHHGTMLLQYLESILASYTPLTPISVGEFQYINRERIDELKKIGQTQFDLSKLIRLCEEINLCYSNRCYFSVIMLVRAMLDHIPPIFQYSKFSEVANNYGKGGKSFKESMERLENSSRNIADGHLHNQIRIKENLPNETQVNYSNDIDLLLSEIIRMLSS